MRKIITILLASVLLFGMMVSGVSAGNVEYEAYYLRNTGYNWNGSGSYNRKATAGAYWFIQPYYIDFGYADTTGTLGIAHAPCIGTTQKGQAFWTKERSQEFFYMGWLTGCGAANTTYELGARVDSLFNFVGSQYGFTAGVWNSN